MHGFDIIGSRGFQQGWQIADAFMAARARANAAQMATLCDQLIQAVNDLCATVDRKDQELVQWQAHAAGLEAQVSALVALHPNTPLKTQPTGLRWAQGEYAGKPKSKLRLTYEQAHDVKARKLGISNPEKLRIG